MAELECICLRILNLYSEIVKQSSMFRVKTRSSLLSSLSMILTRTCDQKYNVSMQLQSTSHHQWRSEIQFGIRHEIFASPFFLERCAENYQPNIFNAAAASSPVTSSVAKIELWLTHESSYGVSTQNLLKAVWRFLKRIINFNAAAINSPFINGDAEIQIWINCSSSSGSDWRNDLQSKLKIFEKQISKVILSSMQV